MTRRELVTTYAPPYRALVRAAIEATPILVRLAHRPAIVLERIARGGGATGWYHCPDAAALEHVVARLSPGSVVSFYFNERIGMFRDAPALRERVAEVLARAGECVVAATTDERYVLAAEFACHVSELNEQLALHPVPPWFAGPFPARDNDGADAITLTLPDADGVVRPHPH